ncbi:MULTISPECIES: 3-oxoacyl-ACP synthase III family protein [Hymenobacter]|uniref:Ketoacyl-ACP synthase III n=2 Tax=Hymenobacter TaxID=89966 RepID=A0ABS6X3J7_9BACT|nr:ketoacyl-ACP synthase III [Hymenobacter sp. NBH84]MBO3271118.1 ketoacyl-ACP synthase III [Hymenobacter defluvii]MBW3130052.1 ketoacyl-ACP synthase III [Hymenobacter profundi]QNE41502.1 ketoacyl-ACP synthase III [Hymenobacter sp. NBH84]
MYIHQVATYLPTQVVTNEHFTQLNGLSDEWIIERTGIRERRKAAPGENTNTMAVEATERALAAAPDFAAGLDLIVGATYTPHDTIFTVAHAVQIAVGVDDIPTVSISSACSSLLNAVEIVEGYFAMGKATRAIVVVSEHNTAYNNEQDTMAGHLWGDGAATLLISKERLSPDDIRIVDVMTGGAATRGKASTAVTLKPVEKGIVMPFGKDVFIHACQYMARVTTQLLERNTLNVSDVRYLIPHQANLRITRNVVEQLGLPEDRAVSNIQFLGNTGCAGAAIGLADTWPNLQQGDRVVITVFGGGYSYGAMLLEK